MTVSLSDNVAADILLGLAHGPDVVREYIASLGVAGFHLEDGERALHQDVSVQYRNWFEPAGAVQILRRISDDSRLSRSYGAAPELDGGVGTNKPAERRPSAGNTRGA